MLTAQSRLPLNNNTAIPALGLGVWQIPDGAPTVEAVSRALDAGYRHIDTAKMYGNETGVGEAVRRSGVPREHVWVTTKLWPTDQLNARRAFEASFARLGLDYIDLYLVHWPTPGLVTRTWRAMEELSGDPRCRAIGVSNHSVRQLADILRAARIRPAVNQVRCSPFGFDPDLLDYCAAEHIVVEAYSPLTRGHQLGDERVAGIAAAYRKTPAQLLIRWALQKRTVPLPKSSRPEHIRENADVFDFAISPDDMARLDALAR